MSTKNDLNLNLGTVSNHLPFEQCQLLTPTTPGCETQTFLRSGPGGAKRTIRDEKKSPLQRYTFWIVNLPYSIILISIIEITFHVILTKDWIVRLRFDPLRQQEVWRFFTYMLVHDDWPHLLLNIVFQILYAVNLQVENWKVVVIYVTAGAVAALGAASVKPDLLIGASGGVYALLISYISLYLLNSDLQYGTGRLIGVIVIILGDGGYNAYHNWMNETPTISWGAHLFGALVGLILGFVIYRSNRWDKEPQRVNNTARVLVPLALLVGMVMVLIVIDLVKIKGRERQMKQIAYHRKIK